MQKAVKFLKNIFPGFVVCLIIAIIAQYIGGLVPTVGSAIFAIFIGMLAGNTFLNRPIFNIGTKFSESKLLEISIVLTGLTLHLADIMGVGVKGIIFIILQMTLTIVAAYYIGKLLGFNKKFSLCMCAGNAVCGSSAIGTIAPVVKADSKDKGISITIVNVTGTVLMIILPLLTALLYGDSVIPTSAMIGGTLQSIGQVIASAKMVSDPVTEMATVFKIVRIIFLVFVALAFSRMNTKDGEKLFAKNTAQEQSEKAKGKFKLGIPWFIIGFFIFSIITSTGIIPQAVSVGAKLVSNQFEIIALAAIGMRVKFKDLIKEGPKALAFGGMVAVCQVVFAVVLIFILLK